MKIALKHFWHRRIYISESTNYDYHNKQKVFFCPFRRFLREKTTEQKCKDGAQKEDKHQAPSSAENEQEQVQKKNHKLIFTFNPKFIMSHI